MFVEKCFILSINKSLGECLICLIAVIIAANRPSEDNEGEGPGNKECLEK